jgi:hypothetical protein
MSSQTEILIVSIQIDNMPFIQHYIRFFLLAIISITLGCSFGEDDDCDIVQGFSENSLYNYETVEMERRWCEYIPLGETITINAKYFTGTCAVGVEQVWSFPEGTTRNTQTAETGSQYMRFTEDGDVCLYLKSSKGNTEKFCKPVKIIRDNVWAKLEAGLISARTRMQGIVVNDIFFAGFGVRNEGTGIIHLKDLFMYNEDTRQFMPITVGIDDPNMTMIASFAIGDKGYFLGTNSKLYEFDPKTFVFKDIEADFPLNVYDALLSTRWDKDDAIVSMAAGNKGYIGLGKYAIWYSFDPETRSWKSEESYDGTLYRYPMHFVYNNKCYVGDRMYDPATGKWTASKLGWYNNSFGHMLIIGDGGYFRKGNGTYKVDIETGTNTLVPNEKFSSCMPDRFFVREDFYAVSAVIGDRGYIITNQKMDHGEPYISVEAFAYKR